jgi:ribose transport system permease protein
MTRADEGLAVEASASQAEEDRFAAGGARRRTVVSRLGLHKYSGIYVGVLLILIFSIWDPHTFPTVATVRIIANEQAFTMMLALAGMVPLITGVFDLSVAQMLGFSGLVVALLQRGGVNAVLAVAITLAIAVTVGLTNAFIVIRLGVNAFIGTLAMTSILAALGIWVTGDSDVTTGISHSFEQIGGWLVPGLRVGTPVLFMIIIGVVLWYYLERVPGGRRLYAAGDNSAAARLTGIRVNRLVVGSFVASATLAAVTGIVYVSQVGAAQQATGPPYLLPAFSAVFLGATQIVPGRFNVRGTFLAVYVLAIGVKGLQLTVAAPWVDDLFTGVTLILAVALAVRDRGAAGDIRLS